MLEQHMYLKHEPKIEFVCFDFRLLHDKFMKKIKKESQVRVTR